MPFYLRTDICDRKEHTRILTKFILNSNVDLREENKMIAGNTTLCILYVDMQLYSHINR